MSKRLSAEDRHAIDLLLERPDGTGKSLVEMVFAHPARGKFEARFSRAAAWQLLQHMEPGAAGAPATVMVGGRRYPLGA